MKIYAWQPKETGRQSFFVMAENEEAAMGAVKRKIKDYPEYEFDETGHYELTVAGPEIVIIEED